MKYPILMSYKLVDMEYEQFSAVDVQTKSKNIISGHEYVDLGLPSGLKWAACNVGAETPEDYGDYFAWGETCTKSEYLIQNSVTYGKTLSDLSDNSSYDVARKEWGGSWRIPTKSEFEELVANCEWERTTQNGKSGYKVTGQNGNSIFLPATGCRYGSSLYDNEKYCNYWSSTPYDRYYAYCFSFFSDFHTIDWDYRGYGRSVRSVSE